MPKIKIHRKKDWSLQIGYHSVFEVLLDGQRIGYLPNGETSEFEVAPGGYKLKMKMGRYGSREHDINLFNKETRSFTVSSMKNYTTIAALLFLIAIEFTHLVLKIHLNKNTMNIIIGAIVLLVIYFQTIGRNSYIFLRENKEEAANKSL
jgi:hypothetical protein